MKLQMLYLSGVHYRQELVSCGKPACKVCAGGPAHGPYWFAYSRSTAFLKKRYVGKELPDEVKKWGTEHDQGGAG
jgi:hypothetical protein